MESLILAMLTREIAKELAGSSVEGVIGLAPMSFAIQLKRKDLYAVAVSPNQCLQSSLAIQPEKKEHDTSSFLVICLDPRFPALFSPQADVSDLPLRTPAETLPEGFVQSMSDALRGTVLNALEQHDADRVVRIEFSGKRGQSPSRLWLELFGRRPSAVLVESIGNRIEACSREGTTSSAGILLRPGEGYLPPSQVSKLGLEALSLDVLQALMGGTSMERDPAEMGLALSRRLRGLSPHTAEEIVERVSSEGRLTPESLLHGLKAALVEPEKHFRPAVRVAGPSVTGPPALLPMHVAAEPEVGENAGGERGDGQARGRKTSPGGAVAKEAGGKQKSNKDSGSEETVHALQFFSTASEATQYSFLELCRWYRTLSAVRLRRNAGTLSERLTRLKALLLGDLSSAERAHEFRQCGELILANLKNIKRGSSFVELKDIHVDGQTVLRVNLDPAFSISDNAERYFKKARKAERALGLLKKRIASAERSLGIAEKFRENIPEEVDAAEFEVASRELVELSARVRAPIARKPQWDRVNQSPAAHAKALWEPTQPGRETRTQSVQASRSSEVEVRARAGFNPRTLETSDGFTVIVGRNNRENDYVTHRLAKPEDLWFHASGVPGSHVILKRKGRSAPSRRAIEETASIAAYFSKGRTSSSVPVIYTEKKYVHKPRGSRQGTATCAREKFLMVTPRKPKPAASL